MVIDDKGGQKELVSLAKLVKQSRTTPLANKLPRAVVPTSIPSAFSKCLDGAQ